MPKREYSGTCRKLGQVKFHFQNKSAHPYFWDKDKDMGFYEPIELLDIAKAPIVSGAEYEIVLDVRVRELPTSKPKKEVNPWDPLQRC